MLGIFLWGHCPVRAMQQEKETPSTAFSGLKRTKSCSHINMNNPSSSSDLAISNPTQELATQKSEGKAIIFLYENKKGILEHKGMVLYGSMFQDGTVERGSCIVYDGYLIYPQEYSQEATFEEKLKEYEASLSDEGEKGVESDYYYYSLCNRICGFCVWLICRKEN